MVVVSQVYLFAVTSRLRPMRTNFIFFFLKSSRVSRLFPFCLKLISEEIHPIFHTLELKAARFTYPSPLSSTFLLTQFPGAHVPMLTGPQNYHHPGATFADSSSGSWENHPNPLLYSCWLPMMRHYVLPLTFVFCLFTSTDYSSASKQWDTWWIVSWFRPFRDLLN